MHNRLIELALESLLLEVELYPKPGLVDRHDQGSHTDMDYDLFVKSAHTLAQGFKKYTNLASSYTKTIQDLFKDIRVIGQEIECDMFKATGGINTHKGANFIYGVVLSLIVYYDYLAIDQIPDKIRLMTKGLVDTELKTLNHALTHGELIYLEYGYTGIRGEVEAGLPLVFKGTLEVFNKYDNLDSQMKHALLYLIQHNDDSNLLKRGGLEGFKIAQEYASKEYDDLDTHLLNMNELFKEYNLSPGGSADLLALTVFIFLYDQELKKYQP